LILTVAERRSDSRNDICFLVMKPKPERRMPRRSAVPAASQFQSGGWSGVLNFAVSCRLRTRRLWVGAARGVSTPVQSDTSMRRVELGRGRSLDRRAPASAAASFKRAPSP